MKAKRLIVLSHHSSVNNITNASSMLRPFGPSRDAQRYARFVRVAALPVSHKTCIALVAPVAGVLAVEKL